MEPTPRTVDAKTYLSVLTELAAQGNTVSLTVTGNSMTPFLVHGRDQICFHKPDGPLKKGDMALFRRRNGDYVMHRVWRTDPKGGYYFLGDGQQEIEGPIAPEQICGVVSRVCRKGTWIGPGTFWWDFFAGPWLWLRPLRPGFRRIWGGISRLRKGGRSREKEQA